MPIEIVETKAAYQGWCRLLVLTIVLADATSVRREVEDHGNAASVLPYDPVRKTAILVRQFRAPVFFASNQEETLEAIAGIVERGSAGDTARREALEEAGLRLATLEHVATGWTMPGLTTERMDLYLAAYAEADRISPGGGSADEHERISVVEIGLQRLAEMADAGELTDIKTLALVQTLRLRRPDLFER